jgi:hypothetical protein
MTSDPLLHVCEIAMADLSTIVTDYTDQYAHTELTLETLDGARKAIVSELPFMPKRQTGNARELRAAF